MLWFLRANVCTCDYTCTHFLLVHTEIINLYSIRLLYFDIIFSVLCTIEYKFKVTWRGTRLEPTTDVRKMQEDLLGLVANTYTSCARSSGFKSCIKTVGVHPTIVMPTG